MTPTRTLRLAQIGLFLVCICVPLALFGVGVRSDPVANRPPAPRPPLGALGLFDTDVTAAFDAYVDDAFPLRDEAIRINAAIDRSFGDSSNPEVIVAEDGWLFLRGSAEQTCLTAEETEEIVETLDRADRIVTATGRTLINVIGPDKDSIFPEKLADPPTCALHNAEVLAALDTRATVVTTWDATRAIAALDESAYRRLDTHWSALGAQPSARATVDVLAPGRWRDDAVVVTGTSPSVGDLTVLLGAPETEPETHARSVPGPTPSTAEPLRFLDRNGLVVERIVGARHRSDWDGAIGGSAVLIHDSFGHVFADIVVGYFADITTISEPVPSRYFTAQAIERSEVIIRLDVQRNFYRDVVVADVAAEFAATLRDELTVVPTGVECDRSCTVTLENRTPGADVYVIATLRDGVLSATVASGDREFLLDGTNPAAAWALGAHDATVVSGDLDGVDLSAVSVP